MADRADIRKWGRIDRAAAFLLDLDTNPPVKPLRVFSGPIPGQEADEGVGKVADG